ncbi:hypothetical protein [Desulfosporosinus sp. OT]|uniref:hypothetical protein n=1 Tax=Desulfosporosinus sp. OT TaxID=913865 RepID=UPI00058FE857|nr:hypothetical protein [Desulfosporosinus sp. OT]
MLNQILTFSNIANAASMISLVMSVFIIFNTKNIKSNLKLIGRFKQFNTDKKTILLELESSLDLIIKDGINDLKNSSDISRSLSKLSHYKDFMTLSHKWTLKRINKLLANKDGINDNNKAEFVMLLSRLNGFLELKQEYIKEIS